VNFVAHGLLDYPTIVKYPMDFGTIKRKITLNAYENELEFQEDMNLVFDNCILYNGTDKDIGKMALQMKMEFNTMFVKEFSA
jgi:bromodomain-containing factor 1